MDTRFVETVRDGVPTRPLTPTASSVDERWDDSPAIMMSPDTPLTALLATSSATHADGSYAEMHTPRPITVGSHVSKNGHCNSKQQGPSSIRALRTHTRPYELEAAGPSKNIASRDFTPYQPGGASQGSSDKSSNLRRGQPDGIPSLIIARPKAVKDLEATPATAIHHSKASDAIKTKRHSTDKETGGDPFLGTGKPLKCSSINVITKKADNLLSPSPARLRSSQLGGTPGLLNLHDTHDEVLSLLDTLKTTHKNQTMNEVDAALRRCQEDMKARAKDKNTGTSESNILDREATRIGRARDEAGRQALKTNGACSPGEGEDVDFEDHLRLALDTLIEDVRAALEAVARANSPAAAAVSASRATSGHIPCRAGEDPRLTALNFENRSLGDQMKRLQAEHDQALKENSDLRRRLDELKDRRRDEPVETRLGPWGKDWNIDSRRGG